MQSALQAGRHRLRNGAGKNMGVQVGHVVALGVELRCLVHGFFEDAQKLWCDLFPALPLRPRPVQTFR